MNDEYSNRHFPFWLLGTSFTEYVNRILSLSIPTNKSIIITSAINDGPLSSIIKIVQDSDIDEMFAFADANSDGRLSFQEFEVMILTMMIMMGTMMMIIRVIAIVMILWMNR